MSVFLQRKQLMRKHQNFPGCVRRFVTPCGLFKKRPLCYTKAVDVMKYADSIKEKGNRAGMDARRKEAL